MKIRAGRYGRFAADERGSVTLEVSMVFPWVLILTFLLILFAVALTQRSLLYYSASVTAERAAFTWSHSAEDARTGAYPSGGYDGLYWRLNDDSLLAGLLGWEESADASEVSIDSVSQEHPSGTRLAESKLWKAAGIVPKGIQGTVGYRNRLWQRQTYVQAAGGGLPDPLSRFRESAGDGSPVETAALVVEPAELIRSFDLVRYYKAKMSSKGEGAAAYRSKAAAVLQRRR